MTYTVFTQYRGSGEEFEGRFSSYDDAVAMVYELGGNEADTCMVPDDDGNDTKVWNLGDEEDCQIAWIEEDA